MLELKKVSKFYGCGAARVTALNDVSLVLKKGDFVAIVWAIRQW